MTRHTSLMIAGNTFNPCLLLLKNKGYKLWADEGDERIFWNASKENHSFTGYSPPELLGLIVLWENFGEDWNRQEPNLLGEILANASD